MHQTFFLIRNCLELYIVLYNLDAIYQREKCEMIKKLYNKNDKKVQWHTDVILI